jgi:TrmH family RNA methyltransferase
MAQLSAREEPSEVVALVEIPPEDLERIPRTEAPLLVVLDRPSSPGNLGSIVRSADALGADGVVVFGHAADVYDPQTVRASQGALFAVPVVRAGAPAELEPRLAGLRVVGTSARGDGELGGVDLRAGTALVLGNETKGLSWAWRERADELVRIPQRGSASSLNLAAAAAILLYEADRQRRGPPA